MTTTPYCETFTMDPEPHWECGTCGREITPGEPCPDHAPRRIPGLQLIECDAKPRHPHLFAYDDDGYPPPCPICQTVAAVEEHNGCAHSHHGRWRRWRITHRLAAWAYALGVIAGSSTTWGGGCSRCLTSLSWTGPRVYVLGWETNRWRCLLRYRHWPAEEVAFGYCEKCLPEVDD